MIYKSLARYTGKGTQCAGLNKFEVIYLKREIPGESIVEDPQNSNT